MVHLGVEAGQRRDHQATAMTNVVSDLNVALDARTAIATRFIRVTVLGPA